MGASDSVNIEDDPTHRLLIARCLKCHEMVVAGKERKLVEAAALRHHCKGDLVGRFRAIANAMLKRN
jgi:hypothetical protein